MESLASTIRDWDEWGEVEKVKQREALENVYGNFVEPHVNQLIEVKVESPMVPVTPSTCFCCVSGWLLLTVLYCLWLHFQKS